MTNEEARWWPPKVGDKLRRFSGPDPKKDKLVRVIGVCKHNGGTVVTVVEWIQHRRRYVYDAITIMKAIVGEYRPDGAKRISLGAACDTDD